MEALVIRIGEVYCGHCGDPFEPDGVPSLDPEVMEFCSDECESDYTTQRANDDAYWVARYGGAAVYGY